MRQVRKTGESSWYLYPALTPLLSSLTIEISPIYNLVSIAMHERNQQQQQQQQQRHVVDVKRVAYRHSDPVRIAKAVLSDIICIFDLWLNS